MKANIIFIGGFIVSCTLIWIFIFYTQRQYRELKKFLGESALRYAHEMDKGIKKYLILVMISTICAIVFFMFIIFNLDIFTVDIK